MSNYGLEEFLKNKIKFFRSDVGDDMLKKKMKKKI